MKHAHTVAQVRAAEAALMATVPPGTLMQRAASGLASACADLLGRCYGARVVVLAGSGDNGGDALWAGARLARRGARVDAIVLDGSKVHRPGLQGMLAAGGRVLPESAYEGAIARADVVLDGIVGIGGKPGLRPPADEVVSLVEAYEPAVVAVDVVSGINVDTGDCVSPSGEGEAHHVNAMVTVTFGTYKIGHFVDPGATASGTTELVDIGLGPYLPAPAVEVLQPADVESLVPVPERNAHKYSRGVLGVLAGSEEFTGAAVLAVGGALGTPVGMVRYVGPETPTLLVRERWPEAVFGAGRVQAWVVGSGLGSDPSRAREVRDVLASGLPVVVDADGLRHLPERLPGQAVLTPHEGELARLLDVARAEVEAHRLHFAQEAARRFGATVLLKGAATVIASPDGRVRVNEVSTPWLATAGSGDVLSGVLGALLASGLSPLDAASVGSFLHGSAAILASGGGPVSASTVAEALPEAGRHVLGSAGW